MKPPADIEKIIDALTDTFELYALCNEFGLEPFINGTLVAFRGQQLPLVDVMSTLITEKSSPTINTSVNLSESQQEALKNNSSKEELALIRAKDKIANITSERDLFRSLEKFSFKTLLFTPEGKELLSKAQDIYSCLKQQPDWKTTHHTREMQIPFKTTSPLSTKTSQEPRQTTDQDHQAPRKH